MTLSYYHRQTPAPRVPRTPAAKPDGHYWTRQSPVSSRWLPLACPTETPGTRPVCSVLVINNSTRWRSHSCCLQTAIWRRGWRRWWARGRGSGRWRRTAWVFQCARRRAGRPGGSPAGSASRPPSEPPCPAGAAGPCPGSLRPAARWAERRPSPAAARRTSPGSWFCVRNNRTLPDR